MAEISWTVERLLLAVIPEVPEWHPEYRSFHPFPVYGWVVHRPEMTVLVDAGVGKGNADIDRWYHPIVTPLADALRAVGLDVDDIDAVVVTHLHFDHCGQLVALDAPVHVQASEWGVAHGSGYTVDDWVGIDSNRLRLLNGDASIAPGIEVLATPGHTPGHQSALIDTADGPVLLVGQCAFRAEELRSGEPSTTNLHDDSWLAAARASLTRIHRLAPVQCHLSHDAEIVTLPDSIGA